MSGEVDRILIAGCGYVGKALGRKLNSQQKVVWGVRRSEIAESFETLALDLTNKSSVQGLPEDIRYVVYAASPSGRGEKEYRAAYIDGVRILSEELIRRGGCERFILVSSTGIFDISDGSFVNERTLISTDSWKSQVLSEAEQQLESLWPSGSASTLRCGGIYGPGRYRMFTTVASGECEYDPDFPQYTNRIHRDDCAGLLQHLLSVESLERVYIGVDNVPASKKEVYTYLAEELGSPKPKAVTFSANERKALGQGKRCENSRVLESGYLFMYPSFKEGYASMKHGYKSSREG